MAHSAKLAALVEGDWEWRLKDLPEFASAIGDHRYDDRLDDRSIDAYMARIVHCKEILVELRTIDTSLITEDERITWRLMQHHCNCVVRGGEFRPWLQPLNRLEGPHIELVQLLNYMVFNTAKDYAKYLRRLLTFPRQVTQVIDLMREGIKSKMLPPRVSLEGVPKQLQATYEPIDGEASADLVVKSPLFREPPSRLPDEERDDLRKQAFQALGQVATAFKELKAFVENTYIPAIEKIRGTSVACLDLPNGQRLYDECLRFHTGSAKTAAEIHRIGLEEVSRIKKAMREACIQCGMAPASSEGDDEKQVKEFIKALKTNPKYISSSAEEHVMKYRDACMRIMPELPRIFSIRSMPRTPFAVVEMDKNMAGAAPAAYYLSGAGDGTRPGCFFVNTSKLDERPFYEAESLALHEGIPGHHTQSMLAAENEDLPMFRRYMDDRRYSEAPGRFPIDGAFIEGWGLYAESLGEELNQYKDPAQLLGRLSAEMFRACRLVVDTGLHAMNWTPQRAMDFMAQHTATSAANIDAEVKRYCTWPGQATGYKIGELEIRRLRTRFMQQLGPQADIRIFHDLVLLQGTQPLTIVDEIVEDYIQKSLGAKKEAEAASKPRSNATTILGLVAGVGLSVAALLIARKQLANK